jgi:quercetin dioxygenase-like cupin family protein
MGPRTHEPASTTNKIGGEMSIDAHDRWQAPTLAASLIALLLGADPAQAQAPDKPLSQGADDPALEWLPCPDFMPEGCGIAVLQGNPSEQNADVFFKLPADTTAPRHWHTSAERMVLVAGEMEIDYDDHGLVVLETGTYAYGPARLPHSASCVSEEDCILFIAFEEPVDAVASDNPFTPAAE